MYQCNPVRSRQSYRHEAFLYRNASDFVDTLVPFVEEGLEAGEPVMVALVNEHADWLRAGLGSQAEQVTFVDMRELGHNPARILTAWQRFLAEHVQEGRPTRGIGEPIWVGRRDEEIAESQLHEALLNVAFDLETPFWLVCPYDVQGLPEPVVDEADRSHHALLTARSYRGSTSYGGRAHIDALFTAPLPPIPGRCAARRFARRDLSTLFAVVLQEACSADLWSDQALDLAVAARQLAGDSLQRGAERVGVRVWHRPRSLVCELSDRTVITDVLAGRRIFPRDYDQGLAAANESCDLVQLRSSPRGTTVRLHAWTS